MKRSFLFSVLTSLALVFTSATAVAQPSALNESEQALVANALKPVSAFKVKEQEAADKITTKYVVHLETLIAAAKEKSAFQEALLLQNEQKAIKADTKQPMDFKNEKIPLSLRKARYDYEKRLADMGAQAKPHKIKAIQESIDLLKVVHQKAGSDDRFEAALEVKAMATKLSNQITEMRPKAPPKPEKPKAITRLEIEVLVDGYSEVRVTPEGVYLVSKGASKPGRHGGRNEPCYINGKAWTPVWGKNDEDGGHDESEVHKVVLDPPGTTPLGMDWKFKMLGVGHKRGAATIAERDAVSTRGKRKEFTVDIPDTHAGSAWYRFELTR